MKYTVGVEVTVLTEVVLYSLAPPEEAEMDPMDRKAAEVARTNMVREKAKGQAEKDVGHALISSRITWVEKDEV